MHGDFLGGAAALLYFLAFQVCGVLLAACFFKNERRWVQAVLGSAAGSVLLMWLPALWAFAFGFSLAAHLLALALLLLLTALALWRRRPALRVPKKTAAAFFRTERALLVPALLWLVFAGLLLHSFRYQDGEIWSSQCTYGDMSMHLGFITSIAEQGTFPPMYSILPGVKLSYPFLSDSISSSLYLLGAPLQFAYFLPMLFAAAQVFFGAWLFLCRFLRDKAKSVLAMVLFFLNGGFGFAYFLTGLGENSGNFTRIFTAFYETPTNLVDENVRWVNVIVDMMLPQRATLFGWALLFPLLYVLYRAVYERCPAYFVPAGIFAGAMVIIHTHSFLALGLICGVWLCFALCRAVFPKDSGKVLCAAKGAAAVLIVLPVLIQFLVPAVIPRDSALLFVPVAAAVLLFLGALAALLVRAFRRGLGGAILRTWGVFLAIVLVLAVPQLLTWTFTQASAESFVRGWFNWGNLTDGYIWFYLVNLGAAALFILPALFSAPRRSFSVAAPAVVIWFICEFVVFQPNTYDNNKLLYAAYFLLCAVTASYLVDLYRRLRGLPGRRALAGVFLVFCTVSAVLTIARESVAGYCLYGKDQLAVAAYVQENTEPEDTILTDMRHNNEIAALTGRNIVCGSSSYVYFHGLDYTQRQEDMQKMFQNPGDNLLLFKTYSVDYVMVSAYETGNFSADEAALSKYFTCVYDENGIRLYKVPAL